ncbi:MAG TPA: DegV family protein [Treponemataceae bacterium]|nr:DegV family protein [Treponemataceae bacterium]
MVKKRALGSIFNHPMEKTTMQIIYLNGIRMRRALIAGARQLIKHKEQLNEINVFPVADNDTGTNLAGTMIAMLNGIGINNEHNVSIMSRLAADSALTGAQGNSGTIVSQFFYGIAEGIKDYSRINVQKFSTIVQKAVNHTYAAISNPAEGTILTVLSAWSEKVTELSTKTSDFAQVFGDSLSAVKKTLKQTCKKIPSLKKAKVVDAGALGFVYIIEGIVDFIQKGKIREVEQGAEFVVGEESEPLVVEETITFNFCTECIIEGCAINHTEIRQRLTKLGDSLIIAGSRQRTKIHVHSDYPEKVFQILEEYGNVTRQKVDNMKKQYRAVHDKTTDIAVVLDSSCDVPAELLDKSFVHLIPLKVLFGGQSYLDKIALSPTRFYELLRAPCKKPATTSQPAPGEFGKNFSFLTSHYNNVIYLGLTEALSGTIGSARSSLEQVVGRDAVHIINTKTISIGTGLIVRRVVEWIEQKKSISFITEGIQSLIKRIRLLIAIPDLSALFRSGRLGKTKGIIAQLCNLRPLLTLNEQGSIAKIAMARGEKACKYKIMSLMQNQLEEGTQSDFAIAHVDSPKLAEWFKSEIEKHFIPLREIFMLDASPALATHTGFGSSVVAYIAPAPAGEKDFS